MIKETVDKVVMELAMLDEIPAGDTRLREDMGVDSLKMVELMVGIEEALDIEIRESDLDPDTYQTMEDLYDMARRYTGAAS
jgi:acyl carrier protein